MNLRRFAFIASLVPLACTASAIQPVEAGLQPLQKRLAGNPLKMHALDLQLEASETLPADRAAAYRRYKLLYAEQQNLLQDIEKEIEEIGVRPRVKLGR